ncbi:MAG: hypothetical protein OEY05_08440 [Paracoccaceae bacterium]|nr:hypothetical protein [Paracoccaceae bacterium]MDH5530052.1 hypothetical protein [Paracoccaceae bacterium]
MALPFKAATTQKVRISRKLSRLVVMTGKLIQEIAGRQKLMSAMGNLSEKGLRDVGLTEDDLMTVRNLGLSTSALELLRDARKKRLGNW